MMFGRPESASVSAAAIPDVALARPGYERSFMTGPSPCPACTGSTCPSPAGSPSRRGRGRKTGWQTTSRPGWGEGIAVVVSLLEPAEVHDLGLQREAALCQSHGMAFLSFPVPDRGLPESRSVALRLAHDLAARLTDGQTVLIHCRAGIGRSAVITAGVMIRLGVDATEALGRIAAARSVRVPDTDEQRAWVVGIQGIGRVSEAKRNAPKI